MTDTAKATIKSLLDAIDPSEPILLMAVVDGPLSDVPVDVRQWFGFAKQGRVVLDEPDLVSWTTG